MSREQALAQLQSAVGREVHVSDWLEVTQERVDAFAEATGDHQWIHSDPVRAGRDSPYGGTIAHGFLVLALYTGLRGLSGPHRAPLPGLRNVINYGINKLRFPSAVRVGSRMRARVTLEAVEEVSGGLQVTEQYTAEVEGSGKPACVAEVIMRLHFCTVLAATVFAFLLTACGSESPAATGGAGAGAESVAVVTRPVVEKPVAVEVEALGTARANEAMEVTSKTANTVVAVRFEEGQLVRRGQMLVELDGAQARADLAAAQAALAESKSAYARSKDLFTQQALSQAQLETIEATLLGNEARVASAAARLSDTQIRATFDGRVGLRRVSVGALVSPGTVITTLDDTSTMKVDFDVPEIFLALLKSGLKVAATSAAYAGETFDGAVESVDSRVDPVTRSIKVRARLPNPEGRLRPGMFLTVRVTRDPMPGLVVAEQALVPERGKVYVFVLVDGQIARREVAIGRRSAGEVELMKGVTAGERVVIEGTQKVRDGAAAHEFAAEAAPAAQSAP